MKRSGAPQRTTPLTAKSELKRTTALNRSPLARSALHSGSAARKATPKRRNTGPTAKVRALVRQRSGGWCEWADCWLVASEQHHRLGRKSGGRRGDAAVRLNQASNLLDACREHHSLVTSPHGAARQLARKSGWLLEEHEDARTIPVLSRHGCVWLTDNGSVSTTNPYAEEATMPNYVQQIESRLRELSTNDLSDTQVRMYTLLVLTRGTETTLEDVHDAWAVDRNVDRPEHKDLVPFGQLEPSVAEWDRPFMELIHKVASELAPSRSAV
jgi:hypothetical protein